MATQPTVVLTIRLYRGYEFRGAIYKYDRPVIGSIFAEAGKRASDKRSDREIKRRQE